VVYRDKLTDATHLALVRGPLSPDTETLVRVHEPLSVIDLLDLRSARHSWNFHDALSAVSRAPCGVIVLLHGQETASELLEHARANAEAAAVQGFALRNYGIGAQILKDLGVKRMRLLAQPRPMPSRAAVRMRLPSQAASAHCNSRRCVRA